MDLAERIFRTEELGRTGYLIAIPHMMFSAEGLRIEHLAPGQWQVSGYQDGKPVRAVGENIDTALLTMIAQRMGYRAWFTPLDEED